MKMTNDLYEYFDITINENIISAGLDKVKDFRQTVLYTDNQFNAFCWAIYQSTNRLNSFQLGDLANQQGLEDSHKLTAVKKILKQYN
jgi:uncharacterized protein YbaA (DUF1428 family)